MSAVARRYYAKGSRSLKSGDIETAMEAFKAAVDLVPTFVNARIGYAVSLARYGDAPRAAQSLRAGLGRSASVVSKAAMWATLGDALTMSGDFPGAEDAFRQAAATPGFEARAAAGLARVYAKLGRYGDSFAQLKEAAVRQQN